MTIIKDPRIVYFWWSAGEVYSAKFVKWVITKRHTGGKDTNKLGVSALLESDWLFDKCIVKNIQHGCKRGQHIIHPYHGLYRTSREAWKKGSKIRRPSVEEIKLLLRNEK